MTQSLVYPDKLIYIGLSIVSAKCELMNLHIISETYSAAGYVNSVLAV